MAYRRLSQEEIDGIFEKELESRGSSARVPMDWIDPVEGQRPVTKDGIPAIEVYAQLSRRKGKNGKYFAGHVDFETYLNRVHPRPETSELTKGAKTPKKTPTASYESMLRSAAWEIRLNPELEFAGNWFVPTHSEEKVTLQPGKEKGMTRGGLYSHIGADRFCGHNTFAALCDHMEDTLGTLTKIEGISPGEKVRRIYEALGKELSERPELIGAHERLERSKKKTSLNGLALGELHRFAVGTLGRDYHKKLKRRGLLK